MESVWALTPLDFEYPIFLVKAKRFLRWVTGYLAVMAVMVILEIIPGHSQWSIYAYLAFACIGVWSLVSIFGFYRGWF